MIYYHPIDGDVYSSPITMRPKTCFLMTKLGQPIPPRILEVRRSVEKILFANNFEHIDASSFTLGRDFLFKIWQLIISVPIGVAIIYDGIPQQTLANIFYELGLMHTYGKETIVIKVGDIAIPSDFVRTEYVEYDSVFDKSFSDFINSLNERAEHYSFLAQQLEKNPLISMDYFRRAYLLTGDKI